VARRFVSRFLLPLVTGGRLAIERPLSRRGVEALARAGTLATDHGEREATERLATARHTLLAGLVPRAPVPGMDEGTWRIGGAVHNLLALTHPSIAHGVGAEARVERVAEEATALAGLGAPVTLREALERHSLLARLPEIVRLDRTVHYWLGHKTFIGRPPPARILALPAVRGVRVETQRRSWLREVGVPAAARPAFLALTEASPLGEALDPLRLDPPPSWGRLLSVLRFPAIARVVSSRLIELGVGRAGDALTDALYRFVSEPYDPGLTPPPAEAVAFALGFLAHLVWLELVFGPSAAEVRPEREPPVEDTAGGHELAVLLAAAERVAPALLRPPDVPPTSELGLAFTRRLAAWFERHEVDKSARWPMAREVAAIGAGVAPIADAV
jgi:hypothetical protein